jgi:hypothetical protein
MEIGITRYCLTNTNLSCNTYSLQSLSRHNRIHGRRRNGKRAARVACRRAKRCLSQPARRPSARRIPRRAGPTPVRKGRIPSHAPAAANAEIAHDRHRDPSPWEGQKGFRGRDRRRHGEADDAFLVAGHVSFMSGDEGRSHREDRFPLCHPVRGVAPVTFRSKSNFRKGIRLGEYGDPDVHEMELDRAAERFLQYAMLPLRVARGAFPIVEPHRHTPPLLRLVFVTREDMRMKLRF